MKTNQGKEKVDFNPLLTVLKIQNYTLQCNEEITIFITPSN